MKISRAISLFGLLAMSCMILYGLLAGNFSAEGSQLLAMPWGRVTLVDLYVGLTVYSLWVVYRERHLARSAIWIVLIMVLGNWATCLYLLLAFNRSVDDWHRFFHGSHR